MTKTNTKILLRLSRLEKSIKILNRKPFTLDQAVEYTGLAKSYFYKLTSQNLIPYYKPCGKKLYFKKRDLDNYIFRNRIPINEDILKKAITSITVGRFKTKIS